jgi:hypothetical protein
MTNLYSYRAALLAAFDSGVNAGYMIQGEADRQRFRAKFAEMIDSGQCGPNSEGWIKASERLPKSGERVFAFDEHYGRLIGYWEGGTNGWHREGEYEYPDDICSHVTHWMPLPNRPTTATVGEALRAKGFADSPDYPGKDKGT